MDQSLKEVICISLQEEVIMLLLMRTFLDMKDLYNHRSFSNILVSGKVNKKIEALQLQTGVNDPNFLPLNELAFQLVIVRKLHWFPW